MIIRANEPRLPLKAWIEAHRRQAEADLLAHKALLFRGFVIDDFEAIADAFFDQRLRYSYRSTPRREMGRHVYTATEYPKQLTIPQHCENAYQRDWPMKLLLYCAQAAERGGRTPFADLVKVTQAIPAEIREEFERKQVRYVRNFRAGVDLPWQEVFGTDKREEVEAYCKANDIELEWCSYGLKTAQVCQALARHPLTGAYVWFNQAHLFHISALDRAAQEVLRAMYGESGIPRNAYFGDGTPIEPEKLDCIREAFDRYTTSFAWQEGDVFLVDNMQVSHGREPFQGERKVLVCMAEPYSQVVRPLAAAATSREAQRPLANLEDDREFWRAQLDGYEASMALPRDFPHNSSGPHRTATLRHSYPSSLVSRLAARANAASVAALAAVLGGWTSRRDVCIAVEVEGGNHALPLRIPLATDSSLLALVERTSDKLEEASRRGLPSPAALAEALGTVDARLLSPVTVRHLRGQSDVRALAGERTTASEQDWRFFEDGSSLELVVDYAADLFSEQTVHRMVHHHQAVLEALVDHPTRLLAELELLTPEERQLYERLNDTHKPVGDRRSLVQLFQARAAQSPDAVACIGVDPCGKVRRFSFEQLDRYSSRLASQLLKRGVAAEDRVAVLCDRSPELLIGLLAIFKAGGCYVPVDPQYPSFYVERILQDARPALILSKRGLGRDYADVWLDLEDGLFADRTSADAPQDACRHTAPPREQLACLMYTSGSTGRPKGVMVPHAQILNWLHAGWERAPFQDDDVVLQKTSIAFAVSVKELLSGLLAGVSQVLVPDSTVKDPAALAQALERFGVSRIHLVPSHLQALLETLGEQAAHALRSLKLVVTAGEALPEKLTRLVQARLPHVALWNNYGCTELNDVSYFHARPAAAHRANGFVPIGAPIANTRVYVLDDALRRVPVGVMGELFVESIGAARGYWDQPRLTAQRFIANPFASGTRLYRTGDMVRLLDDGNLEYLGRRDFELKVRGHRVDVRQVEAAAADMSGVKQAVVTAWPLDASVTQQLAIYVLPDTDDPLLVARVREHLARLLPTYMVPTLYSVVAELPKLPNGKLDRRSLPEPDLSTSQELYVAPRSESERQLALLFQELLGIPRVGIHDDFFNLGGHSLLASQLISRIEKELGASITMAAFFQAPTIERLVERLGAALPTSEGEIEPLVDRAAPQVLSFAQERMWFLHKFIEGTPYNTSGILRLKGDVDVARLETAIRMVVERNEVLRTIFREQEGVPFQVVGSAEGFRLPLVPITDESEVDALVNRDAAPRFDFERDLMLRGSLYRLDPQTHFLAITIHHVAFDDWSTSLFYRDISCCYRALIHGETPPPSGAKIAYRDFAVWERASFSDARLDEALRYWRKQLSGAEPLVLPTTYPRPPVQDFAGRIQRFEIDPVTTERLASVCRQAGATMYMGLLAAFAVLLQRYSGQHDICIGSPVANRNRRLVEDVIGLFVNTVVMRVDVSGGPRFSELLQRVKRAAIDAYTHQGVPFEKLVNDLQVQRDTSRPPLAQVMLNFRNTPPSELVLEGLEVTSIPTHNGSAKLELTVDVEVRDGRLTGFVEYATALFSDDYIRRFLGHLETLLQAVGAAPSSVIDDLPMLSALEERALRDASRGRQRELNRDFVPVHRIFQERARETPNDTALIAGGEALTVSSVAREARRITALLRHNGVGPGAVVGVYLPSSAALVFAVLGTLEAGAAFVLLDPASPPTASYDVLYDSGARWILTDTRLAERLPVDEQVVILVDVRGVDHDASDADEGASFDPAQLAYLSFSTETERSGRGVQVSHGALNSRLAAFHDGLVADAMTGPRFALLSPLTFDSFVTELLQWIVSGGSLCIPDREAELSAVLGQLSGDGVDVICSVPSTLLRWVRFLESSPSGLPVLGKLRLICCAGEELPLSLVERLRALVRSAGAELRLANLYGSRETGFGACRFVYSLPSEDPRDSSRSERVPLGEPAQDAELYVLQPNGSLSPLGVPGELHVGGPRLACGYLGGTDSSAGAFVPRPFSDDPGAPGPLYKTGDLARWVAPNRLDLVRSARDRQRARERRIDRSFVEARLRSIDLVHEASVNWHAASKRLVAHVVLNDSVGRARGAAAPDVSAELSAELARALPEYMMPAAYVLMEGLPVTGFGRVDVEALPEPQHLGDAAHDFADEPPSGPVEEELASIWQHVLKRAPVGRRQSFFDLGGHSISAIQVASTILTRMGVDVPITLLFEAPVLADLAEAIQALRQRGATATRTASILPVDRSQPLPLSFLQERLWFVHQHMEDQRSSYNITSVMRFSGARFSADAMQRALTTLVARHEALRTHFRVPAGATDAVQIIAAPSTVELPVLAVASGEISATVRELSREVFDLEHGPLLKAKLLRVTDDLHLLVTNIHHIVMDGWSFGVMLAELQQVYRAAARAESPALSPLPIQYADYAVWQRGRDFGRHLQYWTRRLNGYEDGLDLPYDYPRAANRAWRAATLTYTYPPELARKVAELSQRKHATLFMSLLVGLAAVLGRYSARRDLCIGTTVAGREQVELESLIGFFINILPLRLDLDGDPSLGELLERAKKVTLDGFEHQALPFEHLLTALKKHRDSSQIPLVPVIMRHQNFPMATLGVWAEGVELSGFELAGERTTASEQDWQFFGDGSSLELVLEYAADLFSEQTMRRMVEHHQLVLEALVAEPARRLSQVELLTAAEQDLYTRVNDTRRVVDDRRGIVQLFQAQVAKAPDAVACIGVSASGKARRFSFQQLDARASQLACHLQRRGVAAETRVALLCDRSPELLIGLLAIFKVGACYVPIDPQYPSSYVERILQDARPALVLSKRGLGRDHADVWLDLEDQRFVDGALALAPSDTYPHAPPAPQQLACLMYTSGSTGRPKGVMVPHAQLLNWLHSAWASVPLKPDDVMLQKTSIAFAVSVKELLSGLLAGVPQVLLADATVKDSAALAAAIERWSISRVHLVPSHLQALLETLGAGAAHVLRSLKVVITAGEALTDKLMRLVGEQLPHVVLWNNYGCTELNDVSYFNASFQPAVRANGFVPIGKPIANTQVYVLDDELRRVPLGVTGELYVHGIGEARGYWDQPQLTAQRFVANPYQAGTRMYRTGDLVRLLSDGNLEYLGRRDFELKVRGHRVDVRQVEAAAAELPGVKQAVVSAWPLTGSVTQQLAVYLLPESDASLLVQQVREHLAQALPTYMVPTLYTVVSELPKLPNGKLDRRSLPEPDVAGSQEQYVAPRTDVELRLAALFEELLGVPHVGVHDDFFDLGGHSLLASRLIARIRLLFAVELPMADVFEHPDVQALAQRIQRGLDQGCTVLQPIHAVDRSQPLPLSFLQERLWFVHQHMLEQRTSYNGTIGLRIRGPLSLSGVRAAFEQLQARHESLRTLFYVPPGRSEPVQLVQTDAKLDFVAVDATPQDIAPAMDRLATHIYDLARGPVLLVRVLRFTPDDHALLIGMHHIVYDGWSQYNVMSRELRTFYLAHQARQAPALTPLPIQYGDYAVWQRARDFAPHLSYWQEALEGYEDDLELPYDYPRPPNRAWRAAGVTYRYPEALARAFGRFNRHHHTTLFMGLLASLALVLKQYTGKLDICIGTTTAGRSQLELEGLIGFFINVLPMRIDMSGDPDLNELMARAKRTVLGAFEHQDLPFERILSVANKSRDSSQIPLVPIMLRHQNFPDATSESLSDELTMDVIERDERTTPNELDLQFFGDDMHLEVHVEYPRELFSESTVQRLIQHHQRALEFMASTLKDAP